MRDDQGMVRVGVDGFFYYSYLVVQRSGCGCGRLLPLLSFPVSILLPGPASYLLFTFSALLCVCVCVFVGWLDLLTNSETVLRFVTVCTGL
jgi:hypothetical protein